MEESVDPTEASTDGDPANSDPGSITEASVTAAQPSIAETTQPAVVIPTTSEYNPAWERYSRPFWNPDNKPMVSLVISGLGHRKDMTQYAMTLPGNVTLSFSPYAHDVNTWMKQARRLGYELLLNLPLELLDYPATDPGPYALMLTSTPEDVTEKMDWLLGRGEEYMGFLTPGSEVYTSRADSLPTTLELLKERGLLLTVGNNTDNAEFKEIRKAVGTKSLYIAVRFDDIVDAGAMDQKLQSLTQAAKDNGHAIAIIRPYPAIMHALPAWIDFLSNNGVLIAPLSAMAQLHGNE